MPARHPLFRIAIVGLCAVLMAHPFAQERRADLTRETVGKSPNSFEPMMGEWVVAEDDGTKVIKVDGAAYKMAQDNPTRLLLDNARRFYGSSNEELMDNAKQFAVFPVAVFRGIDQFSNGTISVQFKTISGDADRASGILFNAKPNGDWLAIRYNDTEHNIAMWEFHNGVRRSVSRPATGRNVLSDPADRDKWHDLRVAIAGAEIKTYLDDALVLEYTLGSEPGPGRGGTPPHADLFPANNPVLRPPVSGRVGLWSKSDSTSLFRNFVVTPAK